MFLLCSSWHFTPVSRISQAGDGSLSCITPLYVLGFSSFTCSFPDNCTQLVVNGKSNHILQQCIRSMNDSTQKAVVYWLRFRPTGINDWIISINGLSFLLQRLLSSLWFSSITSINRSWKEWANKVKCLATGLSTPRGLMSNQFPISHMQNALFFSLTYWTTHLIHWIR